MKRNTCLPQSVTRRDTAAMSIYNAVRFIFAQLFFGFFVFTPVPI